MLIDPTSDGQDALADSPGGLVGLTAGPSDTATCSLLRVGSTTGHTLDASTTAWVSETFAASVTPGYDAAGNLTDDGVYKYSYDAWNRLIEVTRLGPASAPQTIATYGYDGLGHRIYKKVEHSGDMDREEYYYYNAGWQLLEIDNASNVARQQFVWGSNYIDEAVCMDVDTDNDGDCTDSGGSRRFYYMQDANWNVTGLREGTSVVERYEYDPYGTVRIYRGSNSSSTPEQRTVAGASLKWLDASLPGNPVLYAGYFQDNETGHYDVRHRKLGGDRWMQRDRVGYLDGANLYQYVGSDPVARVDPSGLFHSNEHDGITRTAAGQSGFKFQWGLAIGSYLEYMIESNVTTDYAHLTDPTYHAQAVGFVNQIKNRMDAIKKRKCWGTWYYTRGDGDTFGLLPKS